MVKESRVRRKRDEKIVVLGNRGNFICQFCKKGFSKEKTVISHLCEPKRRFQQKDTAHARYGFTAFLAIQKYFPGSQQKTTEEEFRSSEFYLACLKWGRFVIDVGCWDINSYLKWLQKMNVPIDDWSKKEIYDSYTQHLIIIEDPWDSFERNFCTMVQWGEEFHLPFEYYFINAIPERIIEDIQMARVTAWVFLLSASGRKWLQQLSIAQLESIWPWVDSVRWSIRFEKFEDEVQKITKICQEAGL